MIGGVKHTAHQRPVLAALVSTIALCGQRYRVHNVLTSMQHSDG